MNTKIFAIVSAFLTVTIIVALFAFVYVATFAVTGESLLPFRRVRITEPVRGNWQGNVYTSEYLNLRFTMAGDWALPTIDEHISIDVELEDLAGEEAITIIQTWCVNTYTGEFRWQSATEMDMVAVNTHTYASVQILFERLPHGSRVRAQGYLEAVAERMEESGINTIEIPDTTEIGGYEWHSLRIERNTDDAMFYSQQFVNIRDGFARIIVITYFTEYDSVEDILAMFSALHYEE